MRKPVLITIFCMVTTMRTFTNDLPNVSNEPRTLQRERKNICKQNTQMNKQTNELANTTSSKKDLMSVAVPKNSLFRLCEPSTQPHSDIEWQKMRTPIYFCLFLAASKHCACASNIIENMNSEQRKRMFNVSAIISSE